MILIANISDPLPGRGFAVLVIHMWFVHVGGVWCADLLHAVCPPQEKILSAALAYRTEQENKWVGGASG